MFVMAATAKNITVKGLHATKHTLTEKDRRENAPSHFKLDGIDLDIISTFFTLQNTVTIVELHGIVVEKHRVKLGLTRKHFYNCI